MRERPDPIAVAAAPSSSGWIAYDRRSQEALWVDPVGSASTTVSLPDKTPGYLRNQPWPSGIRLRAVVFTHLHCDTELSVQLDGCRDVPWIAARCDREAWMNAARPADETALGFAATAKAPERDKDSWPASFPFAPWCTPEDPAGCVALGRHLVRLVALPGHTLGSLVIMVGNACFTGHTLVRRGIGTHPRTEVARAALREGLSRLVYGTLARDDMRLYCGDGSVTTRTQERRRNAPLVQLLARPPSNEIKACEKLLPRTAANIAAGSMPSPSTRPSSGSGLGLHSNDNDRACTRQREGA